MIGVATTKPMWRAYSKTFTEERIVNGRPKWVTTACPDCGGRVCDECRKFTPIGVVVKLECGTLYRYNLANQTYRVIYPGAPITDKALQPTGEFTKPEEYRGQTLLDLCEHGSFKIAQMVHRAVLDQIEELNDRG